METAINYVQTCGFCLPCGVCTRTNSICPIQGQISTEPLITGVYAAPVYPYSMQVNTERREDVRKPDSDDF